MVHFSGEQLISLCSLALDELVRRMSAETFARDKVHLLLNTVSRLSVNVAPVCQLPVRRSDRLHHFFQRHLQMIRVAGVAMTWVARINGLPSAPTTACALQAYSQLSRRLLRFRALSGSARLIC